MGPMRVDPVDIPIVHGRIVANMRRVCVDTNDIDRVHIPIGTFMGPRHNCSADSETNGRARATTPIRVNNEIAHPQSDFGAQNKFAKTRHDCVA